MYYNILNMILYISFQITCVQKDNYYTSFQKGFRYVTFEATKATLQNISGLAAVMQPPLK